MKREITDLLMLLWVVCGFLGFVISRQNDSTVNTPAWIFILVIIATVATIMIIGISKP